MILRMNEEGEFFVYIGDDEPSGVEVKELPEVCPEVWNTQPVDGDRAMAAIRSMCRSGGMSTKEKA